MLALGTMNFGKRTPAAEARRSWPGRWPAGSRSSTPPTSTTTASPSASSARRSKGRRDQVRSRPRSACSRLGGKPEGLVARSVLAARRREPEPPRRPTTIDVYYLHAPDPHDAARGDARRHRRARRRGKIRAFGVSNYAVWQILEIMHALRRARPAAARPCRRCSTTCWSASSTSSTSRFTRTPPDPHHRLQPARRRAARPGATRRRSHPGGLALRRATRSTRSATGPSACSSSRPTAPRARRRGHCRLVELAYAWLAGRAGGRLDPRRARARVAHLDAALDAARSRLARGRARGRRAAPGFAGTDASYAR